jgi:uncharacterized membrane protein HdeD (DUF308 family)
MAALRTGATLGKGAGMTTGTSQPSSIDRATAMTEEFIDRGAPWGSNTSWQFVMAEGAVAIVAGLLMLFKPFGGTSTTLQIVGLILLLGALITSFQVWRERVAPERVALASFRAGSGVTVGILVLVATFLTDVTDAVSATLAAVVGVGFLVFGGTGVAAGLFARVPDQPLPTAGLILNAVLAVAGVVLILSGAGGAGTVNSVFTILGIVLVLGGVGLVAYGYLLRQQEATGVRT